MSKIRKPEIAQALLLPINPAAISILGLYTVAWGVFVALPFWNVFSSATVYMALAGLFPEVFWGLFAIFCGSVTLYGAAVRKYRPLVWGAQAAFWHWLIITTFYVLGNPYDPSWVTGIMLMVYSAYIHLNIKTNFKNDKNSARILHDNRD